MSSELLINVMPGEIRAAEVDGRTLMELVVERRGRASLVGNIYLGRVQRTVQAMEAAFVDLGVGRAGFIGIDAARDNYDQDRTPDGARISDYLVEGQAVMVQVVKDPIGSKGAQLTRRISLPGRHLVYTPVQNRIAVSRLIEDEDEQRRLTEIAESVAQEGEGFILRTNAVGATRDDLAADAEYLRRLWIDIEAGRDQIDAPGILHAELDPLLRVLRDNAHDGIAAIRIDSDAGLAQARAFCTRFMAPHAGKLVLHGDAEPIFDAYDIEEEIERALKPRIDLPSGGGIVIQSTEALTAIDVNSGRFTSASGPEHTALHTNLEAAVEVARQIRLRNIGGLIVVDFIHMDDDGLWERVLAELERGLVGDRNHCRLIGLTEAGLVEMTRRRRRESLADMLTERCGQCGGTGHLPSISTVSHEVMRMIKRQARKAPPGALTVMACEDVIDAIEELEKDSLEALAASLGRRLSLRREAGFGRGQYDIVVE